MTGPLLYATVAGALSAFNPCGFVLLPTYAASFLAEDASRPRPVRLLRVSTAMAAGFFTVFAAAGLAIGAAGAAIPPTLPKVMVLAVAFSMALLGALLLSGITLPGVRISVGSTKSSYTYGIAYAAASLACALPVFLSAVVFAFGRSGGFTSGMAASLGYAAGMSAAVSLTIAAIVYAGSGALNRIRGSVQHFSRAAGALMLAGAALLLARETLGLEALDRIAAAVQNSPSTTAAALSAPLVAVAAAAAYRKVRRRVPTSGERGQRYV